MDPQDIKKITPTVEKIILWVGITLFMVGLGMFFFLQWNKPSSDPDSLLPSFSVFPSTPPATLMPLNPEFITSFSCPSCKTFWTETLAPLMEANPSFQPQISLFPLQTKGEDMEWTLLVLCAQKEGKDLKSLISTVFNAPEGEKQLPYFFSTTGLSQKALSACTKDQQMRESVLQSRQEILKRGVTGTPTLFLAGEKYEGLWPKENIELEILKRNP
ncbi:MAG: thioredoxin domain-containing protein [Candidatus Peregrinibacteria bacterium]